MPTSAFSNLKLEQAICWSPLMVSASMLVSDVLWAMNQAHAECLLTEAQSTEVVISCAQEQASCVLVMDGTDLVGIFTERDVVRYVAHQGGERADVPIAAVMTPNPITLTRSQLSDFWGLLQLLRTHQIRHLPIVDEASPERVGLMTTTTIRQVLRPEVLLRSRTVAEVMTQPVIQASSEHTIVDLSALMAQHSISCIVVSEQGQPKGIVTERDLVQFQSLGLEHQKVRAAQIMSQPVFQISPATTLWQAHQQMQQKHIRRLVVTDEDGGLQGIVTQTDVLRILDPWEMYATVNQLQGQVGSLEQERLRLLQDQNNRLEALVQARTAEIEALNRQLEQRVAERTAQSEQQLAAMDAAIDGIALLKGDRYCYINPAHLALFGYTEAHQLLGKSWRELYAPDVITYFEQEVFPLLQKNQSWIGEVVAQRQDGTTFDQSVSLTVMASGTLVCVCQDISDRKRAEVEMRKALAKERELNDLKSRFISMTSHEFRTPLAVISSSAGILKSFGDRLSPAKKTKHLDTIQTYVRHTTQLLDDILTINRAEAGKLQFNPEPLELVGFCQQVIQEMQLSCPQHCLQLVQHNCSKLYCQADPKLLRQVLINLLSNAVKYSPQGGDVVMALLSQEQVLSLSVQDHGIGIPLVDQARLFESFHRATNVGTIQGTGLGLSIIKKCVERQGGTIRFESVPEKGTTFTITLPQNPAIAT